MSIIVLPLDATAGSPTFTAQQSRQAMSVLFGLAPAGRPLGAVSGVRPGTPSSTVFLTGGGSTTWNVAAHAGVLDTQSSALAGPYAYATTGGDTGTITAADPSNPRVDIVYVKVNDNAIDGSGLASGTIGYLAGTPAATPSAPTVPARGMVLATITVPRATFGSPTVTWVAPVGGVGPEGCFTGGEAAFVGAAPPAGTPKIVKQTTVVTTVANTAGGFSFNYYGGAFPNGIVSVVCVPGDNASGLGGIIPVVSNCTLGGFNGIAQQGTGSVVGNGLGIRVNYIAIGW